MVGKSAGGMDWMDLMDGVDLVDLTDLIDRIGRIDRIDPVCWVKPMGRVGPGYFFQKAHQGFAADLRAMAGPDGGVAAFSPSSRAMRGASAAKRAVM